MSSAHPERADLPSSRAAWQERIVGVVKTLDFDTRQNAKGPGDGFPSGDWDQDVQCISDWLVAQSLGRVRLRMLFAGFCDSLNAAGMPLLRAISALSTLHPMYVAHTYTWVRGQAGVAADIPHGAHNTDQWQKSPLKPMFDAEVESCRYDPCDPGVVKKFPLLAEVRALGGTDYLGLLTPFDDDYGSDGGVERLDGLMSSWVTDRPGGFTNAEVAALKRLVRRFALAAKMVKREETALNIVTAYLGRDAGCRVLSGQIKLGDGELLPSVIWYSDLRGSTALCERLSPDDYLAALNQYFACSAGAVLDGGGEVLRFIGDAVLGIFPIGDGPMDAATACAKALAAAGNAREKLMAVNVERRDDGGPELDFGLGLHVGEVMYGNIGVPTRVEFSVTGPAANEVARLEDLTKQAGEPILASRAFAQQLDVGWRPLGAFQFRGVADAQEVFAPPGTP